jgi:hypothetical protein
MAILARDSRGGQYVTRNTGGCLVSGWYPLRHVSSRFDDKFAGVHVPLEDADHLFRRQRAPAVHRCAQVQVHRRPLLVHGAAEPGRQAADQPFGALPFKK